MQNIPAPTTRTFTRTSGETVHITEWTIGWYTLRKTQDDDYTDWTTNCADRDLPRVEDVTGFGQPVEFGVSCSSIADLSPEGATAYAAQIVDAAEIASTFNEIVAAN